VGPSLPSEISCGHKTVRWLFIIFNVIFSVSETSIYNIIYNIQHSVVSVCYATIYNRGKGGGGTTVIGVQKAGQIVRELIDLEL